MHILKDAKVCKAEKQPYGVCSWRGLSTITWDWWYVPLPCVGLVWRGPVPDTDTSVGASNVITM